MDYRVKALIDTMRKLDREARSSPLPKPDSKAVAQGLRLSKQVCTQPVEVVATPIMKNLMICLGDIQEIRGADGTIKHTRLRTGMNSKAVAWMNKVVNAALLKYNGPEQHDYPESIPVDSKRLYDIDCWNGWKKEVWDIQPGQEKQVAEGFKVFTNPRTNMSVEEVIRYISNSPAMQRSVIALLDELPMTRASREVRKINDPFMSKGTGVSYPDYRNDRSIQKGDRTYAQYEIDLAVKASKGGILSMRKFALENNVYTGYARWQRGKGRPLIAESRRTNLIVNCINGPEMQLWKASDVLNAAFVDEEKLLAHLSELGDFVLNHPESDAANIDYSKWDQNLGSGWIAFQDAARYMKAADEYTRQLILIRYICNARAYFVNGLSGKLEKIYGRMTSGYDDTTLGNSTGNRGISRGNMCTLDPHHIENYTKPLKGKDITCVGDDLLAIGKKGFIRDYARINNPRSHTLVHEDEKHARGIMFIQYRAFKLDAKWVMAYNWPRVLRSMLSKESAKQLGRGGWTLSFYQQLGKLVQVPEACKIALNIAAALDQYHLSLDVPVAKIIEMVQEEDAERIKEGTQNRKVKLKRKNTTAERLYNSNPNIPGIIQKDDGGVELDQSYFSKIQSQLKSLYDPNFLPNELGIKNPDLGKISARI